MTPDQLLRAARVSPAKVAQYVCQLRAKQCQQSFLEFIRTFWPLICSHPLKQSWYIDAIADHLQHLPELKRLIISVPIRSGKSLIAECLYPAWLWANHPELKLLCVAHSLKKLAIRDSQATRAIIQSEQYQSYYRHVYQLNIVSQDKLTNNHLGERQTGSPESAITGMGFDILIADDLNEVNQVWSDAERQKTLRWWTQVVTGRMNPGNQDSKVIIAARSHQEDVIGFIKSNSNDWVELCLPYEYEPKRKCITPLFQDPRTEDKQPLHELFTPAQIKELKGASGLGPIGWASQFQQLPRPSEGAMFQESWFHTYQEDEDFFYLDRAYRKDDCTHFISSDFAVSLKTSADFSVLEVWAVAGENLVLVEEVHQRMEMPTTIKFFKELAIKYDIDVLYVEDQGTQKGLAQMLRKENLPVKGCKSQLDKKARAQRAVILAECGKVWLPESADEWLAEICAFPFAPHDDRLDAFSMAGQMAYKYFRRSQEEEEPEPDEIMRRVEAALST